MASQGSNVRLRTGRRRKRILTLCVVISSRSMRGLPLDTVAHGDRISDFRCIMDIQEAESHADGLGRDLMHWDIDWQSCSNQTCHDHCSRDDCIQMCDGMSLCEDASLCMKEDCEETTCLSSCSSDPQHCLSVGVEDTTSTQGQHALQDGGVDDHPGSIQCPWILPGEPCDVTVGTRNALGRHIYEKHIDPQLTLRCPLESCTELIPKSNLPSHQAQQHRLENYPCSWDSCANIYPTSDDLFNHIMTSHGYLDCHFGGCEVSLKDPTQLQNHVVEDHLDVDFSWPDDFMFDQQLPPNDGRGFEPFSAAVPRNQSYPEYECGGEHCQLHYHGSSCPYGPGPDHSAIGSHKPANLAAKIVEQQKLPRTYADRFESVWRESRLFHQPQSILAKNGSSSETSSPLSCTGSTTAVSEQGRQLNGRNCKWVVNSGEQSLCNRAFDTAEDLQEHLTNDHCKQNKASRSAPKIKPVCRWHGCGRNGEPLNDTHKLIRHVLTHSDRTYRIVIKNTASIVG